MENNLLYQAKCDDNFIYAKELLEYMIAKYIYLIVIDVILSTHIFMRPMQNEI